MVGGGGRDGLIGPQLSPIMQSLPPWVRNDKGAPMGSFSQPQQSSGDGAAGTIGAAGAVA
ncbi:hypothetical protein BHQ21_12395 [Mycobacterium sherrisii]|uniref:Uncharacterized protein n=1 Tax=Mycobacterium sherrisii TaxID=243061 RepID=A0A1E3SWV8_9MYCO|nr:hypothetical protein BHQ21_12395 [Mycobacterium sherrisii]